MMVDESALQAIATLSREYGTTEYVRGGGGNTSVKDEATVWIKPSGKALREMTAEGFVAVDRGRLEEVYAAQPPTELAAREAMIKDLMKAAVRAETPGRASVETLLHDSLEAAYAVHTHPPLVNGLTCAKEGKAAAQRLFPEALWVDYVDPGYTLCMHVRERIAEHKAARGEEPAMILLKNHGGFVAGATPAAVREIYGEMMEKLEGAYREAGVKTELEIGALPEAGRLAAMEGQIREALGDGNGALAAGAFEVPQGPLTPDHIVYAKAFPYIGEPTAEGVAQFRAERGYLPQVIAWDGAVFGAGKSEKEAGLTLELAEDGARVLQLTAAFGGVEWLDRAAREFIENWEVEAYRKRQV